VGDAVGDGDLTPPSTVADVELLQEVRSVIATRASYGYRRTAATIWRQRRAEGKRSVNHKRRLSAGARARSAAPPPHRRPTWPSA
jgi:hypothetical protein